jgi:hypothetical protein
MYVLRLDWDSAGKAAGKAMRKLFKYPRRSYLGQLRFFADIFGNIIGNIRRSTEGYGMTHLDTTAACGQTALAI